MPYVKYIFREKMEKPLDELFGQLCLVPKEYRAGVFTYCIYKLMMDFHVNKFQEFAVMLGILESVKQEYYRRVVAPYEDIKIQENGDVV